MNINIIETGKIIWEKKGELFLGFLVIAAGCTPRTTEKLQPFESQGIVSQKQHIPAHRDYVYELLPGPRVCNSLGICSTPFNRVYTSKSIPEEFKILARRCEDKKYITPPATPICKDVPYSVTERFFNAVEVGTRLDFSTIDQQ